MRSAIAKGYNEYKNRVEVVAILQDAVRVKLITEDGRDVGVSSNCLDVPMELVPPDKRRYGTTFVLMWRGIHPGENDTADDIREALSDAHQVIDK
jgi:hypothetical protein